MVVNSLVARFVRGRYPSRLVVVALLAAVAVGVVVTPADAAVSKWSSVSAGFKHTCGIKTNGSLWCWGLNNVGQLGLGDTTERHAPTQVGTNTDWASVAAGDTYTCGLTSDGTRYCWGNNGSWQLGLGVTENQLRPTRRLGEGKWKSVSVKSHHSCGIRTDGTGHCWGNNFFYQFGRGKDDRKNSTTPKAVSGGHTWNELHVGGDYTCGIDTSGVRYCWGSDDTGDLGLGTGSPTFVAVPTSLAGDGAWTALSLGSVGCGLSTAKRLYCWGSEPASVEQNPVNWRQVSVGSIFTCGITSTRTRYCMGLNNFGQLGLGHTQNKDAMTSLEGDGAYLSISAGGSHACGISTANRLYCWGENKYGEVGDGATTPAQQNLPVLVS